MTEHNQTSRWQSRMRLIALNCNGALRCAADESHCHSEPPLFGHTYRGSANWNVMAHGPRSACCGLEFNAGKLRYSQ